MIGPFLILYVSLADWLGAGLQTLLGWFDSNIALKNKLKKAWILKIKFVYLSIRKIKRLTYEL